MEADGGAPPAEPLRSQVEPLVHESFALEASVLARRIDTLAEAVDDLREEVRAGLAERLRHTEAAVAAVHEASIAAAREHTEAAVAVSANRLERRLDTLRRAQSRSVVPTTGGEPRPAPPADDGSVDPALYVELEERFRGDPSLIAERQRGYVPYVADLVDDEHQALDLGCGRGEWLALLAEAGVPARGIDSNPLMVAECQEAGLEVAEGNLLEHLRSLPDGSLGAVTMFQVVEHLPFPVLVATLEQAARVLRPGGVLIAETPNASNLRVAASTFWIDPTHVRPLHPELLVFLATYCGFSDAEPLLRNPLAEPPDLGEVHPATAEVLHRLVEVVDGPGDVAVVAHTPTERSG